MKDIRVVETFYSLQGEGGMAGRATIFIRLGGCNKKCWFCDTEFNKYDTIPIEELHNRIKDYTGRYITWTGGEPALQLTEEIVDYFKQLGYSQGIETNGSLPVPKNLDYIACAPKVEVDVLNQAFDDSCVIDELRYPLGVGEEPPMISELPACKSFYISPLFLGEEKLRLDLSRENLDYCIEFCKSNPEWALSVQQHKLWGIA